LADLSRASWFERREAIASVPQLPSSCTFLHFPRARVKGCVARDVGLTSERDQKHGKPARLHVAEAVILDGLLLAATHVAYRRLSRPSGERPLSRCQITTLPDRLDSKR
jgi:hypothetical protein